MNELEGKIAIVNGAGSGIGAGIAQALAEEGMKVAVADVDADAGRDVAKRIQEEGAQAEAFACDVSSRESVERLAANVGKKWGPPAIVCNNAGTFVGGPTLAATEADWRWLIDVNLLGVVHGASVFAPLMLEAGEGHIVNTASVGGFLPYSGMAVYCATKAAVVSFSESLRQELEAKGIGVSTLCPGSVATNLAESDRLRPSDLGPAGGSSAILGNGLDDGMAPVEVGRHVVTGIRANAKLIFTHAEFKAAFEERFQEILADFSA